MKEVSIVPESFKILIVDDEPANVMLLTKLLSTKGCKNIISTHDSREVASIFKKHDFDLVLLDINMPDMNGYEVLEQLRQTDRFNNTQVVAVTGNAYPEDIKKGLDLGFSGYLTKPMKMNTLFDLIDRVLERMNG